LNTLNGAGFKKKYFTKKKFYHRDPCITHGCTTIYNQPLMSLYPSIVYPGIREIFEVGNFVSVTFMFNSKYLEYIM